MVDQLYEPGQIYVWSEWNTQKHTEVPVLKLYGDTNMYYKFAILQMEPVDADISAVATFRLRRPIVQTGTIIHMHRRTHNIMGRVREGIIDPNSRIINTETAQFKHFRTSR